MTSERTFDIDSRPWRTDCVQADALPERGQILFDVGCQSHCHAEKCNVEQCLAETLSDIDC